MSWKPAAAFFVALFALVILAQPSAEAKPKRPTTKPTAIPTITSTPTTTAGPSDPAPNMPVTGPWILTFRDEFNSTTLDRSKWADNWFGGTVMSGYTKLPGNVTLDGSEAVLSVNVDAKGGSGAILTTNPWNGGGIGAGYRMSVGEYVEARILFPGAGTVIYNWPAWWINGTTWPIDGEADVFEGLGSATSNYHYGINGKHYANNSGNIPGVWANEYHTYGLHRLAGRNDIYWDGQLIRSYPTYDNGAPQYLLLTNGEGNQTVTGPASAMRVDYVRSWART